MIKRIFLVGMAGSGKSTIGKALAKKLNWQFIDIDERIEKVAKKSIGDIFENKGSFYFSVKETEALDYAIKLGSENNIVIATGGRTYLKDLNQAMMIDAGLVIYLEANSKTLFKRLKKPKQRAKRRFLKGITQKDLKSGIKNILEIREEIYNIGSVKVNANRDKAKVIADIIKLLEAQHEEA